MNRLARERSPYLLQHASNPVDWHPWGEEAFAKARAEDKPIFLSVGYSTCHWCHVMAHESFESQEIAAVLNESFVCVKVDREERPDVDRVYMTFVQATTGSGGWPMSVWLTPDLQPFFGGTYFAPAGRFGRPGFVGVLQEIARIWRTDRARVTQIAESILSDLTAARPQHVPRRVPGDETLARMLTQFRGTFDRVHGGFGDSPKFPRPSELLFLMREHVRTQAADAREMALQTLRGLAGGGVRDHIGGGFHRYSVDTSWRVPHFEKMLYDQAQLALAFLEAAQLSGESFYARVAEDTLQYVLRDMTAEGGAFYSAEDADSVPAEHAGEPGAHAMEGAFYLWTAAEIAALAGEDEHIFTLHFGVRPGGNAPADPAGEFAGKNILYIARQIEEVAREAGESAARVSEAVQRVRARLFEVRSRRPRPGLDDKVLTAWNGLMIAALARASRVLPAFGGDPTGEPYRGAAIRAASFIRDHLWDARTRSLLRRYRAGEAAIQAYAEDYAALEFGILELLQADPDPRWLEWALQLQRRMDDLFWDDREGAWFSTTDLDPTVLLRLKDEHDGAEPAPSSIGLLNLIVLSQIVHDPAWAERIERTIEYFGSRLADAGLALPMMGVALSTYAAGMQQIVLVDGAERRAMHLALAERYLPFAVTFDLTMERQRALADVLSFVASMQAVNGRATAYVCRDFSCHLPATSVEELNRELARRI